MADDTHENSTGVSGVQLDEAAELLRTGELVAFPTETVYGLGANALDQRAVAKVFVAKGRPRFDPLIVHVADADQARDLVAHWPDKARQLANAFWPGPLTLVLNKKFRSRSLDDPDELVGGSSGPAETQRPRQPLVPDLVTAGLSTVAVRVPQHPVALELIRQARVPVAAPSANRFGGVSPTTARHVRQELGDSISEILDGGPCATGLESTVLSLIDEDQPRVLRLGGVPVEAIEQAIGPVSVATGETVRDSAKAAETGQISPGMLSRHYAPRTTLHVVDRLDEPAIQRSGGQRLGLLAFADLDPALLEHSQVKTGQALSEDGELEEAATRLFACLRELDEAGVDAILAEWAPEHGLGRAINDRLKRASYR